MSKGYIDVHHHIIPPLYKQILADYGVGKSGGLTLGDWTPQKSLDLMEVLTIDKAYCSLSEPALYPIVDQDPAVAQQTARQLNEEMAELCQKYPERFGAFAVLPLPDVDRAIEEAIYALDVLKLDGVGLLSNYHQDFLGDQKFDRLFDELEKRQAVIYIHPSVPPTPDLFQRPEFVPYDYFQEFCFNTHRAASNLVLSGTMARCPSIRPILSHMGGTLPFLTWRLDTCYGNVMTMPERFDQLDDTIKDRWSQLDESLDQYFARFYYDCALSSHPIAFSAVDQIAPGHALFGSDAFYASLSSGKKFVQGVEDYYSGEALDQIKYKNALKLFEVE